MASSNLIKRTVVALKKHKHMWELTCLDERNVHLKNKEKLTMCLPHNPTHIVVLKAHMRNAMLKREKCTFKQNKTKHNKTSTRCRC